jgi:hypothetical protein
MLRWTVRKLKFLLPALVCWIGVGFIQRELNQQRADPKLGLTRVAPLENAPPVLAFTTVALGGFRGLIANALWIRATDLQDQGKYFEMVQLADWITKLEPHFVQVWLVQAWNMAYNISVKFTDAADRWRWVYAGVELLRDQGLRFNPKEALIYRELAWFYQHKMGQNLDDAHWFYKMEWARLMTEVFGSARPDFDQLLSPTTEESRKRLQLLREKYKMEPAEVKAVDEQYGPLDWRLPEATALYWASVGLKKSDGRNLITLRRVIYQSMHMTVLRGRIISLSTNTLPRIGPDLSKAAKAEATYEDMLARETEMPDSIRKAHRNYLREVVWLLYTHNRLAEANQYFQILRERYPEGLQPNWTAEDFALDRINANIEIMSTDRVRALVEGLLRQYFISLAYDEDDRAAGMEQMARRVWQMHTARMGDQPRLRLPPIDEMKLAVLAALLGPPGELPPEVAARLRTRLGLAAPTPSPQAQSPR